MLTLYGLKTQCLTMSFESTSAPWASNKCTMAVLPSWAAMWSGVRSTFVLASRDIPARRSTSAVATWPYWAAKWSGLVPSYQQIDYVSTNFLKDYKKVSCISAWISWFYSACKMAFVSLRYCLHQYQFHLGQSHT